MKVLTDKQKLEGLVQKGPLLRWLKQQPNKYFNYSNSCECCLAQYLKGQGFVGVHVGCHTVTVENFQLHCPIPPDMAEALCSTTYAQVIWKLENTN